MADVRIFGMKPVSEQWVQDFKRIENKDREGSVDYYFELKKPIKDEVSAYTGTSYLFKWKQLDEGGYQIKEIDSNDLSYFDNIDDMANQTDVEKTKWINYFK